MKDNVQIAKKGSTSHRLTVSTSWSCVWPLARGACQGTQCSQSLNFSVQCSSMCSMHTLVYSVV